MEANLQLFCHCGNCEWCICQVYDCEIKIYHSYIICWALSYQNIFVVLEIDVLLHPMVENKVMFSVLWGIYVYHNVVLLCNSSCFIPFSLYSTVYDSQIHQKVTDIRLKFLAFVWKVLAYIHRCCYLYATLMDNTVDFCTSAFLLL